MAAAGSVFPETLQEITNTKLEELSKRRSAYEAEKAALLRSVEEKKTPLERLYTLSDGAKRCLGIVLDSDGKVTKGSTKHPALEIELKNLDHFLAQARHDPSVSTRTIKKWEDSLMRYIDSHSLKFAYASLYGQLVTEWLSSERSNGNAAGEDIDMTEDFETIDNAKKLEAKMIWEQMVFEPAIVDQEKLKTYLNGLFGTKDPQKKPLNRALGRLRTQVKNFEKEFRSVDQFTPDSLRWVIQGLVRSDLLTDEKREVLKDFANNEIILVEVADVLNMRMAAIGTWSWGPSVPLEQRRRVTGAFSIYMHEDLLQAIFLHYIGVKLSIFFKKAFGKLRRDDEAWVSNCKQFSPADRNRMEYYLGSGGIDRSETLQNLRRREHRRNYFMSQLVRSENQPVESIEGEEEADYAQPQMVATNQAPAQAPPAPQQAPQQMAQTATPQMFQQAMQQPSQQQMQQRAQAQAQAQAQQQQAMQVGLQQAQMSNHAMQDYQMQMMLLEQQNKKRMMMARNEQNPPRAFRRYKGPGREDEETDDEDEVRPRRPMEMKKRVLHLLTTEITINTTLYGDFTAFHTVFSNWYSLFPHQTIESIMTLFGFSATWLKFFKSFLEAPLKFIDDDGPVRIRRRGTPGSHALSEVFGEVTLFVLDFAVNQATSGGLLWRLHDDFWFWSPEHERCVEAWKAVREFVDATGTNINYGKTGTARITEPGKAAPPIDPSLPPGDIRWGFLRLSSDEGHFVIDQQMVDKHIVELRKQLTERSKSVFNFIQTWNVYVATFFTSNFGKPANCFGKNHVDEMLKTHERIQREIFASNSSLGPAGERSSNIVEYLKNTLEDRFGVSDIPDGYLFFPAELGGLDLQSPFIPLLQIRDSLLSSAGPLLKELEESELDDYKRAKKIFDSGNIRHMRQDNQDPRWEPQSQVERENFISFQEFVKDREAVNVGHGINVRQVYERLMTQPVQANIDSNGAMIGGGITPLMDQPSLRGIHSTWHSMEPYWKWVVMLYGPEILERFGGLNIVDPGLLPMGMVKVFREKRVKWQN
ncbi:hypothetical protein GQ53DRAFT_740511 [Thozetella sp. PMI_491]|nr:hypothetical protein GQ53DRAFT_740511 [Thozetella sp. PMI_491]